MARVEPTGQRPRRRRRLSLRGLIALVLIAGGAVGWYVRGAREEERVAAVLKATGAAVFWDWEIDDEAFWLIRPGRPGGWRGWVHDRLGPGFAGHVSAVIFEGQSNKNADDDLMREAGRLRNLERLTLIGCTKVTDAGIAELSGCRALRRLELDACGMKGAGLSSLSRLGRLRVLSLRLLPIEDDELRPLAEMDGLEELYLESVGITDAGLVHLGGLTGLRGLELSSTHVTEAGLARLAGLTKLTNLQMLAGSVSGLGPLAHLRTVERLWLIASPIDDEGLEAIAGWDRLRDVNLNGTQVGDAGLVHLRRLGRLRELSLADTRVSDAGLDELLGLMSLDRVDLRRSAVTKSGADRFARMRPDVRAVQW